MYRYLDAMLLGRKRWVGKVAARAEMWAGGWLLFEKTGGL